MSLTIPAPARSQDPECEPSQAVFTYGKHIVGDGGATGYMHVTNHSQEPIIVTLYVDSPHFGGTAMPATIPPGSIHQFTHSFNPRSAGDHEAVLDFGNDLCATVLLRGTGIIRSCSITPPSLQFDSVPLGQTMNQVFTVYNDGDVEITVTPFTVMTATGISGGATTLQPDEAVEYTVSFTPFEPGYYSGQVQWGFTHISCDPIYLTANAKVELDPGDNRIGVYFDEPHTDLFPRTTAPHQIITGYLVLNRPADSSGIAAWECRADIDGNAFILDWQIEGDHVNAGLGNELIVGLGGDPLPHGEQVLLAEFQMYVADPLGEPVAMRLGPIQFPTIPGMMAWIPGAPGATPLPMLPITGVPSVAWVNHPAGTSAVGDPPLPDLPSPAGNLARFISNAPNPFNPSTEILIQVPQIQSILVRVFDLNGRLVRHLYEGAPSTGTLRLDWDGLDDSGRKAASGAYFLRLESSLGVDHRKVTLLK